MCLPTVPWPWPAPTKRTLPPDPSRNRANGATVSSNSTAGKKAVKKAVHKAETEALTIPARHSLHRKENARPIQAKIIRGAVPISVIPKAEEDKNPSKQIIKQSKLSQAVGKFMPVRLYFSSYSY